MPCTLANSDTWDIHVLGKTLLFSTFLLSNFQGSLSLIILPFIWRNCVLNSSSGDGQKEDGSQSKGNVHGQGNSQLPKLSYKYFRVQYSTVLIVEQTPSRSGNRIGIGRHVCNSMLRPKNHNYFFLTDSWDRIISKIKMSFTYGHFQVNNQCKFGSLEIMKLINQSDVSKTSFHLVNAERQEKTNS